MRAANPENQEYTKVQGTPVAPQESIPAATLIGVAYGFIWLAVLFFLLLLWRRGQHTARELDELKRRIDGARAAQGDEAGKQRAAEPRAEPTR